ncbi:6843_t:CDS:2, partial [Funneliformis geosporum]
KLRDNNEENKELTFLQTDNISKKIVSGNGQNNNTIDSNTSTMNSNTSEASFETSLRNNEIESNTKTVSSENDQQKTIPRLKLKFTTDDSDEIELTKNQNIELDLICDLQNCSIVTPPNEQHLTIKSSEVSCNQVTTQNLIHLFRNTVRVGHEEILSWICYSDNFEDKVAE